MAFKASTASVKIGPEFGRRMRALLKSEEDFLSFMGALEGGLRKNERSLRLNPLRTFSVTALQDLVKPATLTGIPWCSRGFWVDLKALDPLESHPLLGAGLLYLQEAGAMEAVSLLDVKPGHLVLDLCAAPGGKATQIGEELGGQGWLVASDPVRSRAERLDRLTARHGLINSSIFSLDPSSLAERFPAFFDRVLVDAPCSGESLFAKRAELRSDIRDVDVEGCARRQFVILNRGADMLKAGGRLVYSTCTYSFEENEAIVESFLKERPEFEKIEERRRWPHIDGVAGGYAAVLEKKGPESAGENVNFQAIFEDAAHGALRHGPLRWNGEADSYVEIMAAKPLEAEPRQSLEKLFERELSWEKPQISLSLDLARLYLQGQALPLSSDEKGFCTITWESHALGPAKAVENRLNNLLPKILRGLV